MSGLAFSANPKQARAEEIARYDATLFGACGEHYLQDLQTLAKVLDVEPGDLSPNALWNRLRPFVMKDLCA